MKSANRSSEPMLVSWREIALIGSAFLLIAIASQQQSVPRELSPSVQPVQMSPDTTVEKPAINSA